MPAKPINIAVDGYSSTGKSTMARALAQRLGFRYIDTGAMYRGITLYALRENIAVERVPDYLDRIQLDFRFDSDEGRSLLYLQGEAVEEELRSAAVAAQVSKVAALSPVRRFLVAQQKAMAEEGGVVMDGRDIGTVVLPQAELKIFMTADPKVRAQRRYEELRGQGQEQSFAAVAKNLAERDHLDSTRADSPLRQAEDARLLDNTALSPDEQLDIAEQWAQELMQG